MAELPFNLKIRKLLPQAGTTETVTCGVVLRTIDNKRSVYDAAWNGQSVIAKVFLNNLTGQFPAKKEWSGLVTLQKLGLNSPRPLFLGKTEDGKWVTVVEKIQNSSTALSIFHKAGERIEKISLMNLVCVELAKQHHKGVEQKDLHLGNFLISGDKVFALDTAEMKFHHSPLLRKQSIAQLALLAGYLPQEDAESIKQFCHTYFAERGWEFADTDFIMLQKTTAQCRKSGIKKWLKKSLRTSTRTLQVSTADYTAVFDRTFCGQSESQEFIKEIDSLMDGGEILKKGNTCYVSAINWDGKDSH